MKHFIRKMLRRSPIGSYTVNPRLNKFLTEMKGRGHEIKTVFDVGAFTGQFSLGLKNTILPNADFYLFEANPECRGSLEKTRLKYFCGRALSSPEKKEVMYYGGNSSGNSYYRENTKWYDEQEPVKLQCTTLDQLVSDHSLPVPQLLKLDTQGSELDILRGASFLDKVDLVYCECPIIKYNSGAPEMSQYLDFFRQKRLIPVDIFEIHRIESTLVQVDILFVKGAIKEQYIERNVGVRPF